MKKCVMAILYMSFYLIGKSQGLEDWVSQKATQKKYLLQQIAALKVYLGYLQKGYNIAEKGLNAISEIKKGHLNLDKDFFTSLQTINPKVRNYTKVAEIIAINVRIIQSYKKTMNTARQSEQMNRDELEYMNAVFVKLIDGCADLTDELMTVLSVEKLKMSDGERIKRIDSIYDEMQERFVFADSFGSESKILSLQRDIETRNEKSVKTLTGIQP